jgi:hypothetical protein
MTTKIAAPKEGLTTSSTALSLEVETQGSQTLFLRVPVGDAAGNLMTPQQFEQSKWTIAQPDPDKKNPAAVDQDQDDPEAEPEKPDAELRPRRSREGNIGQVPVTRRYQSKRAKFKILVERFTPPQPSDAIKLELVDSAKKLLADTTVIVRGAEPKIKKFESDKFNFRRGAVKATLSWEINPAGRYRLQRLTNNETVDTGEGARGQKTVDQDGEYRLETIVGSAVTDTRSITLYSFGRTQFESTELGEGLPTCAEILGIYQHEGKLYAVVRDSAAGKTASIWSSDGRLDRKFWVPIVSARGKDISISAQAAARPGVVFDEKLYFIGGSSYDADYPGSRVSYFHFESKTWVLEDPEAAWPRSSVNHDEIATPLPKPRMGHALLAAPDDSRLWLVGGYNGDGGARNDIWVYDKATGQWAQTDAPPWEPRCLFGAAFCGPILFIAGGFDNPGGYPTYDDIWYFDTSSSTEEKPTWHTLDTPLVVQDRDDPRRKQYRGCALASIGNQIYAFVSYGVLGDPDGENKVLRISRAGRGWGSAEIKGLSSDWVTSTGVELLDYYRFDATPFGGGIFVRQLARAAKKDTSLHYLMLF